MKKRGIVRCRRHESDQERKHHAHLLHDKLQPLETQRVVEQKLIPSNLFVHGVLNMSQQPSVELLRSTFLSRSFIKLHVMSPETFWI
jgi:hypothetical protein